jgi:hypothetical protein
MKTRTHIFTVWGLVGLTLILANSNCASTVSEPGDGCSICGDMEGQEYDTKPNESVDTITADTPSVLQPNSSFAPCIGPSVNVSFGCPTSDWTWRAGDWPGEWPERLWLENYICPKGEFCFGGTNDCVDLYDALGNLSQSDEFPSEHLWQVGICARPCESECPITSDDLNQWAKYLVVVEECGNYGNVDCWEEVWNNKYGGEAWFEYLEGLSEADKAALLASAEDSAYATQCSTFGGSGLICSESQVCTSIIQKHFCQHECYEDTVHTSYCQQP